MAEPQDTSGGQPARNQVYVVLGAGRSGTSALTRGVGALGVELGDNLKAPGQKNAKGFFEDNDILRINYRLHELVGLRKNGSSVRLVDDILDQPGVAELRQDAIETLRRRFGDVPIWGFKCVGVMRLLPFWESVLEALDLDIRYVLAIRHPLDVAGSRRKLDYFRGFQEKSDLEWLTHVVPYFRRAAARPYVVVDYDRLMAAPERELTRIARAHGLPLTEARQESMRAYAEDFLSKGLQHNRSGWGANGGEAGAHQGSLLTMRAYRHLYALASDADEMPEDWSEIEAATTMMAPALAHLDRLEDELRGRFFGLNTVLQTVRSRAVPAGLQRRRRGRKAGEVAARAG